MNALLPVLLIVGIVLGVIGLMAFIAWLTRPDKPPKIDKHITIKRLIERPTMEARFPGLDSKWSGWCTVCGAKANKYDWYDWSDFEKHEYENVLNHKCPTVEEMIKNAPKWERVNDRRRRGSDSR